MPDHMHLFVRGGDDFKLAQWVNGLKRAVSVALGGDQETTALAAGIFRSRVAQRRELYPKMEISARESGTRGPTARADHWQYQGEIVFIDRA
jgi:hypothetical protein